MTVIHPLGGSFRVSLPVAATGPFGPGSVANEAVEHDHVTISQPPSPEPISPSSSPPSAPARELSWRQCSNLVTAGFSTYKRTVELCLQRGDEFPEESAAVELYTGTAYHDVNAVMRGQRRPLDDDHQKAIDGLVQLVNRALQRRPVFEGTVYRGLLRVEDFYQLHAGAEFTEAAFLSSSTSRDVAETRFAGEALMVIRSRTGRKIEDLSTARLKDECEVLFAPGTRFRVTGTEDVPNPWDEQGRTLRVMYLDEASD